MPLNPSEITGIANQVQQTGESLSGTRQALDGMKGKMKIFSEVGGQLRELAADFKNLDAKEKMQRLGGIIALGVLGYAFGDFNEEEREWMQEGVNGTDEPPSEIDPAFVNEVYEDDYQPENETFETRETRGEISVKQTLVNMFAMRFYNKDGTLYARPSGIFTGEKPCQPSKFIIRGSTALFENGKAGLGTFDEFVDRVTGKLVHEDVQGKDERIRQAAIMLSHCAVGRYQILPLYHFKKLGWPIAGKEGLRAMYDFIRQNDRQIDCHMAIIKPLWDKYKDPAHVGIAYYAGESKVQRFIANPTADEFTKEQFGGFGSIKGYADRTRSLHARAKSQVQQAIGRPATDLEALEIALERIESGGTSAYQRIVSGESPSDTAVANARPSRSPSTSQPEGTRILAQSEVTPEVEAAARLAQQELAGQGVGARKRVEIDGKTYVFQREIHTNRDPNGAEGTTAYVEA